MRLYTKPLFKYEHILLVHNGAPCQFNSQINFYTVGETRPHVAVVVPCVKTRAVKVSALIYEINVAVINAIKYFNAVNATLFTSGVFP